MELLRAPLLEGALVVAEPVVALVRVRAQSRLDDVDELAVRGGGRGGLRGKPNGEDEPAAEYGEPPGERPRPSSDLHRASLAAPPGPRSSPIHYHPGPCGGENYLARRARALVRRRPAIGQRAGLTSGCSRYQSIVRCRPSVRSTSGSQPVSWRSFVASTNWRSISPAGLPVPLISGSTPMPARRAMSSRTSRTAWGRPPPALNASPRPSARSSASAIARAAAAAAVAERKPRSGEPSERSTGARPSSAAQTASGTRREKLRSPPP